jgi:hypothetical protein
MLRNQRFLTNPLAADFYDKEQWKYRPWKSIPEQECRMKLLQLLVLTMIILAMFVAWMMR